MKIYQDIDYIKRGKYRHNFFSHRITYIQFWRQPGRKLHLEYLRKEKPENLTNKTCNFKCPTKIEEALCLDKDQKQEASGQDGGEGKYDTPIFPQSQKIPLNYRKIVIQNHLKYS